MAQPIVKRGSVVLIRYPFTDLTGAKARPALVVTPDHLLPRLEDVLCLFISSGWLKRRSVLRMHKLALLHKVLVLRVLGEGDPSLMDAVDQRLRLALGLHSNGDETHE